MAKSTTRTKTAKAGKAAPDAGENQAWEERHTNDRGSPLSQNESSLPDRSSRQTSPDDQGEISSVTGTGYQASTGGVHPNFDTAPDEMESDRDHLIRTRAYELWEERGRPEGQHDDHWREAEEEYGRRRSDDGA